MLPSIRRTIVAERAQTLWVQSNANIVKGLFTTGLQIRSRILLTYKCS